MQTVNAGESPIIDCHQHLWDLTKFKLPWIKPGTLLGRSYVMSDYLEAIAGTGIKHAVYMEVDVDPAQQVAEAEHLIDICQSGKAPTIAAVVSGRPAADEFSNYIKRLQGSPAIKGIRQVLHGSSTPAGFCLQDNFVRGIRLLGEKNLSFDLCLRPTELSDGAALAEKCPETRFIVDHCGNADPKAFFKPGDSRMGDTQPDHAADAWRRVALIGVVVGMPSLRIKGLYLAIATLAGQLIIEWTINHVPAISGGAQASIEEIGRAHV